MKFLSLIWGNLKRKKLRTILTLLSVFIAFLLFGLLTAMTEAFSAGVNMADADRLIVRHKVSLMQTLPYSYNDRIASVPGVAAVSHQTWFGGIYKEPKNFIGTFPVNLEALLDLYPEVILDDEAKKAWAEKRTAAIVGKASAERFGWKIGDRVPFTSPIWGEPPNSAAWEFDIVGIFDTSKKGGDNASLFFRYDYFEEARQREKGKVGWYVVRVKDPDQAASVAKAIDEQFANSPYETKAEPEGAFAAGFAQQIGDIGTIMTGVLSAVFFTILLVTGNTMAQSVRERTSELGTLKAIGFTNRLVMVLVMAESCVITVLAGLAGLGLSVAAAATNPAPQFFPIFFVPQKAIILGAVLTLALGLIAGFFPAWQAMRLRIADALRRNG